VNRLWIGRLSVGAGVIAVSLAIPGAVPAQTRPLPQIPTPPAAPVSSEAAESGEAPAAAPQGPGSAPGWVYSLGLGAGWESNVGLTPGAAQSDFGGVFNGGLTRSIKNSRGDVGFSARALGYVYNEQTQHNSLNGDVRLHGQQRLARTTTGSLDLSLSSDQSYNSSILIDQGVLLPATRVLTYSGSAELVVRASERTTLRGGVMADRSAFPDSVGLQASTRLRMSADLNRRMGQRDSLALVYSAELADAAQPTLDSTPAPSLWSQYFSTQWSHKLSSRSAFLLEAGASYTPQGIEAGLQRQWSFFGGASLDTRVRRATFTAYYRREVIPVFGVGGLRLADRVGLNAFAPFGQRWVVTFGGAYSGGGQQDLDAERQSTTDAFANAAFRMSRRLWLSANGRYLRQSAIGAFPALEDGRAALLLVLATPGSVPSLTPWR
jgi:hypothetical protein